jgi:O-antigen ligase
VAQPPSQSQSLQALIPLAFLLFAGGAILFLFPAQTLLLVVAGAMAFFVTFLNTELAIHLIIFSMLLSPEAVIAGGGVQIGKPALKGPQAVFRLEDILLGVVGLSWFARTALHKELGLFLRTPLNRPIAAYALANVLATVVGVLQGTVRPQSGFFFTLKYLEYFVLYFMMVNNLRDEAQLRRFLFTGFTTAAIAATIGILQIPSGQRVAAPFEGRYGEPNAFGGYLLFMLGLVLALWLQSTSTRGFFGWLGLAGLILLPFFFTLSRASYVGAIPMLLVLLALTERRLWIAIPIAIAVISGSFVFPKAVQERVLYTFTEPPHRGQYQIGAVRLDSSTSARLDSFRTGLNGWLKSPLLGYGVTGFFFMDAQYVRTLTETGIVGLAAFFWLVVSIVRAGWHAFRTVADPFYRALAMGYLAGFAGLLAHGLGANTFIIVRVMEPFWFFTAIVIMLPQLVGTPSPVPTPAPGREGPPARARGATV